MIAQRFHVYKDSIKKLRDKTLSIKQIDDRFAHIKRQAQLYWGQAMQVRFEAEASEAAEIAGYLADDHESMMFELEQSELVNSSYIKDLISNVGEVLKDSIEDVLFNAWQSEEKIDNPRKARKQFLKELKLLGFNNDEYAKLVDGARRLLALRDCLLLNKKINSEAEEGRRAQFIIDHDLQNKKKEEIDAAIHLDFMQQLKPLINQSFTKIYNLHEKDIKANNKISVQMKNSLIRFLKKLTNSEEQYSEFRQICSVQMQIGFLKGMAKYLENMRDMPSIKARRFVRITRASFIGGAIGLGVCLAAGWISFGIIPIVLIGCCIIGSLASSALMRFDYFKYLRSSNDRKLLTSNIQSLKSEAKRLKTIAKEIVSTDLTHQTALKKFEGVNYSNSLNPFKALASIFKRDEMKTSKVLIGSADALMREYFDRYRHSVFIEVDFQKTIKPLILRAAKQTQALQEELLAYSAQNSYPLTLLKAYIENTSTFLEAEEGTPDGELRATMESLFNIREKLREQILEIVSALSVNDKIPDDLLNFYKNELRGSEDDLKLSRSLSSLDAVRIAAGEMKDEKSVDDEKHFKPEVSLRSKMEAQQLPIFAGSDRYRTKMGDHNNSDWGRAVDGLVCADNVEANPINADNVEKYLEQSKEFLLSLDARNENLSAPATLNAVYEHSLQYIIYRAMFLKQLAEMVDPTDENYKPMLSVKILNFAENKLSIEDPKKFFKEIQHQDNLLPIENKTPLTAAPHQEEKILNKTYKGSIVDAIRVSITYDTKPTTALDLMSQRLGASSIQENDYLFGINPNILEKLGVPRCQRTLRPMLQTISKTEKLFYKIVANSNLTNYKVHEVYFNVAMQQILQFEDKISENLKRVEQEGQEKKNLTAAKEAIKLHRIKLNLMMKLQNDQLESFSEIKENNLTTINFTLPAAHALFQPKNVAFDLKEGTQEKLVKSALLKALSAYTGDKNSPIQFNLGWLLGEEEWKIKYRNLLNPFLNEKDRNLFLKVADGKVLVNAM